nr:hypothetical protein [Tanacetum cinerariifolium]
FNSICYDDDDDYDDEESTIPLSNTISQLPPSIVITTSPPVLPIEDPEDCLIMGNEKLNTILEKESDEFIKSNVEDLIPIPCEFEDTSGGDSECVLLLCDDFSPINIFEEKPVTFSNHLFNSNDDFTSSDDESLSDEDVPEDNVKIYSNPLFEFDDEYISSDVNPLFDEVLKDIECKDSYDSNLDESTFLVTPLFDVNEDEYFTPCDDVELLLYRDPSTSMMRVISILEGFTYEPSLKKNDDLFDLESKVNEWKKILYDAPIDDLMSEDKVFDPRIYVKIFSPTYVSLPFEDRPYLFFTYVVRILLLYFIYPVVSHFLLSSRSEDTIFNPDISAFYFSHVLPLLQELARAADSHDIKDQRSVLFQREAAKDLKKMQDYYRLSGELGKTIRMRDAYISELRTKCSSNDIVESIEILQLDDTQAASHLMLTAREIQEKCM